MKIIVPKRKLKTSKDLMEFCKKNDITNCVMKHKGGIAIIMNRRAAEIFVGKDAAKNAIKTFKEYTNDKSN